MSDEYCICEKCEIKNICQKMNKPYAVFCDRHRFDLETKRTDPDNDKYEEDYYLVKSTYKKYAYPTDTLEEFPDGLLPVLIHTRKGIYHFMKEKDLFFENGVAKTKPVEIGDSHVVAKTWYEFKFISIAKKNYYGFW